MFLQIKVLLTALLLISTILPPALATETDKPATVENPGTDLWRAIRQNNTPELGRSQVQGVESAVLINSHGEDWRRFRMEQLVPYSGYALGGIIAVILLFYLIRGPVRIEHGRSGVKIIRFRLFEQIIHWVLAVLFIILSITGLVLLGGRFILLPWMGPEAFTMLAELGKIAHNVLGPPFMLSLLIVFVLWVKKNIYRKGDLTWLSKFGGMLGGEHASAGFFNMGEKIWFWLMIFLGIIMSVTGLILILPTFGLANPSRVIMETALAAHGTAAVMFIAVSFGHMYLATFGTEGTWEGMVGGRVDTNWVKLHHDLWYEELAQQGTINQGKTMDKGSTP